MNPLQSNQIPQVLWESRKLFMHNYFTMTSLTKQTQTLLALSQLTWSTHSWKIFTDFRGARKSVVAYNTPKKKFNCDKQYWELINSYLSVILLQLFIRCNNGCNNFTSSDQLEKQLWTTWIYYEFKQFVVFYLICNLIFHSLVAKSIK